MNRIKELRKKNGLTLKQLGNELNIKDNTLSQYENEKRSPNNNTLNKIAKYFNVSLGYIAGIETSLYDYQIKLATHISNIYSITTYTMNHKIKIDDILKKNDDKVVDEAIIEGIIVARDHSSGLITFNLMNYLEAVDKDKYKKIENEIKKLNIINGSNKKDDIKDFRINIQKIIFPLLKPLASYLKDIFPNDIKNSNWKVLDEEISNWFKNAEINANKSSEQKRIDDISNNILSSIFDMNSSIRNVYSSKEKSSKEKAEKSIYEINEIINKLEKFKKSIINISKEK